MTAPAVRFNNPRTATRAYLGAHMSGSTVGTAFPTSAQAAAGYLQVAWDGTPSSDYPVTLRATIRVTAWHVNPSPAETLALDALAVLGSFAGDDVLFAVQHLTGPLSGVDEDSGLCFASCTYRVSPTPL